MSVSAIGSSRSSLAMTVAVTSLGFAVVRLDGSIVNVALPQLGASFGIEISGPQWVVDAYALAFASLLLSAGALGDRIGARRGFVWGFAIFSVGSLACALAPGAGALVAARAGQGIGAALLLPCSLALLNHACGDDRAARARSIGWWAAAGGVGVTAGPVLGGLLVSTLGWQSIFLVNLPIGLIGIWLTSSFIQETELAPAGAGLDLAGQALAILTLTALAGAVIKAGPLGWRAPLVVTGLIIAATAAVGFVVVEARSAAPIVPLSLFRNPSFGATTAIGFLVSLTMFGLVFLLSLYFQQVLLYSPSQAGLAFVPFALMVTIANIVGGWIAARMGARPVLACGLLVAAVGYALLRDIDESTSYASMLPGQLMIRAGIGMAVPTLTMAMLSSVDRANSGIASGVLNAFREAGGALGVALFGALMIDGAVAGIQSAINVSTVLLILAAALAIIGIRRG